MFGHLFHNEDKPFATNTTDTDKLVRDAVTSGVNPAPEAGAPTFSFDPKNPQAKPEVVATPTPVPAEAPVPAPTPEVPVVPADAEQKAMNQLEVDREIRHL